MLHITPGDTVGHVTGEAPLIKDARNLLSELNKEERYLLHCAAREQMKKKLLADILIDMQICSLEGWNPREFVDDLHKEISNILTKFKSMS